MSIELIKTYQKKNKTKKFNFDAFDIITLLVKKQNKILLNEICKEKGLDCFESKEFIQEFLKIGFYTPIITDSLEEEQSQIYIIKKHFKKYKRKLM